MLRSVDRNTATAAPACSATWVTEVHARSCAELLHELHPDGAERDARLLRFVGVDGRDVYNITAPFIVDGQEMIAGRVEHRSNESSDIVLFRDSPDGWTPCFTSSLLKGLQDPCIARIHGELVIGGVRYPVALPDGSTGWQMEFYRGRTLASLRPMFRGPERMKDIRLCGLPGGRVAVFSRPQGLRGGKGKIGFTIAENLDAISADLVDSAPLLPNQFAEGEWGGANEAHLLEDGTLGVLGHMACWDQRGNRHYYPISFVIDPETLQTTRPRVIARRDLFPAAPTKRPDLVDVVFSGGLVRQDDGTALLYAGLSDAAAGVIRIPDPFEIAMPARAVA